MKSRLSIVKTTLTFGILLLLLMSVASCSKKSGGSSDAGAAGATAGTITVQANPTSITANGTSTITATVTDSNGNLVADGTIGQFFSEFRPARQPVECNGNNRQRGCNHDIYRGHGIRHCYDHRHITWRQQLPPLLPSGLYQAAQVQQAAYSSYQPLPRSSG